MAHQLHNHLADNSNFVSLAAVAEAAERINGTVRWRPRRSAHCAGMAPAAEIQPRRPLTFPVRQHLMSAATLAVHPF